MFCDEFFSVMTLPSLKAQSIPAHFIFFLITVSANEDNLSVKCLRTFIPSNIITVENFRLFFLEVRKPWGLIEKVISHGFLHCCLPDTEEICFINNVQEVVIILKNKPGHCEQTGVKRLEGYSILWPRYFSSIYIYILKRAIAKPFPSLKLCFNSHDCASGRSKEHTERRFSKLTVHLN